MNADEFVAAQLHVEEVTIVRERVGLARFAAEHKRQVQLLVADGSVAAADASLLGDRIDAFVGQVLTGLHVAGDSVEVRRALRSALDEARLLPGQRS